MFQAARILLVFALSISLVSSPLSAYQQASGRDSYSDNFFSLLMGADPSLYFGRYGPENILDLIDTRNPEISSKLLEFAGFNLDSFVAQQDGVFEQDDGVDDDIDFGARLEAQKQICPGEYL